MKYSIVLLSLLATAFAVPQGASSTITSAASVVSAALTPAQSCIASCSAGDVNCQAACVGAAHPNSSQVDQTTQCAMGCDQGDGSPAATEKYSQCVQACISSYFPTSQTVAAAPAGSGVASTGASGTGATGAARTGSATGTQTTGSATGSATGAAASASKTGAAVINNAQLGASAAGFAGLFMAIFAL
ncbi:hypothetical protein AOQ84DRAFT_291452 [Glonium stellatum]|uniref:Uncharacterized protein n=1 Tax=Glonium stellatum TaxID=574774 RepID=A0A8E2F2M0_9PEZI|nr:hypothetical protein AOQ84DRAFT_291452 [Glonium stellatum]